MNYEDEKTYLEFGGEYVYIDFDEITNVIKLEPPKEDGNSDNDEIVPPTQYGNITIDVIKWEMINKMIDTILDDLSEEDPTLGRKNLDKLPVSFKIAYNTLLNYNIIKIVEE